MAGHWGSAPRPETGLIGPTEAAAILGVSVDLVRKRSAEGDIPVAEVSAGGHRRYRRDDIEGLAASGEVTRRPPGVPVTRIVGEPVRLDADQQREAMRIAEAAATVWTQKVKALDWDQALSDATFGVAVSLTRPKDGMPWNVSAWNHAQWQIQRGIRKASGVSSRQWDAGVRYEDLPPELRVPVSLEAAAENGQYAPQETDDTDRAVTRLAFEECLSLLSRLERVALVNSAAHLFDDAEIAADMGVKAGAVRAARQRAAARMRHEMAARGIAWPTPERTPSYDFAS